MQNAKCKIRRWLERGTNRRGEARSANAKCRMQNAKLGDGANEAQTVRDDVSASQIAKNRNQKHGSNEVRNKDNGITPLNLIHRKRFSLRLGHTRGKMILNHFLTLSCRFATLPKRGRSNKKSLSQSCNEAIPSRPSPLGKGDHGVVDEVI